MFFFRYKKRQPLRIKKAVILCAAAFLAVSAALFWSFREDPLERALRRWGVRFDVSGFERVKFSEDDGRMPRTQTLEAVRGTSKIIMSRTFAQDNRKYIEDKAFLLRSLFESAVSPYPEAITNIVECPEEFKPKAEPAPSRELYTLFAGERFNYGICTADLIAYHSVYGIFDCKQKGVFEIRIFSESGSQELRGIVRTFSCGV